MPTPARAVRNDAERAVFVVPSAGGDREAAVLGKPLAVHRAVPPILVEVAPLEAEVRAVVASLRLANHLAANGEYRRRGDEQVHPRVGRATAHVRQGVVVVEADGVGGAVGTIVILASMLVAVSDSSPRTRVRERLRDRRRRDETLVVAEGVAVLDIAGAVGRKVVDVVHRASAHLELASALDGNACSAALRTSRAVVAVELQQAVAAFARGAHVDVQPAASPVATLPRTTRRP